MTHIRALVAKDAICLKSRGSYLARVANCGKSWLPLETCNDKFLILISNLRISTSITDFWVASYVQRFFCTHDQVYCYGVAWVLCTGGEDLEFCMLLFQTSNSICEFNVNKSKLSGYFEVFKLYLILF